ncbi:hypothetical protein [Ornithinibacillus halophilus]|uniref:Uncharacterized protein n=1 Tax=Ornithinibacillus halophilus TaxID=930117 RepID=A0A1M5IP65_9BACI|nr:hypothetical protein [Ornithinibacillus halophilus]SHG30102.1 hypothetical protein SAMN05216225_102523 [Ornithinibacillus halophilus]
MKKTVISIFSCILVGLFFVVAPLQTQVLAQNSEESIQSQTKTVTQTIPYGLNDSIDASIEYDVAGWSGILYLINTQSTGDHILATYRGTVRCSGFCGIPPYQFEEDE